VNPGNRAGNPKGCVRVIFSTDGRIFVGGEGLDDDDGDCDEFGDLVKVML